MVPSLFKTNPAGAVPTKLKLTLLGSNITPFNKSLFKTEFVVPPFPPINGVPVKSSTIASTAACDTLTVTIALLQFAGLEPISQI